MIRKKSKIIVFWYVIISQLGDDPKESLPNYVYTEKAPINDNSQQENENNSLNDTERQMDVSSKTPLNTTDQSETPLETSTISTRNSSRRSKTNTSQRSTLTRKQAKEKELINGHNEVRVLYSLN